MINKMINMSMYDRVSKFGTQPVKDTKDPNNIILFSNTLIPLNECLGCINADDDTCLQITVAGGSKTLMSCESLAYEDVIQKAIEERMYDIITPSE